MKNIDVAVLQTDVAYIKEAVREIKEDQRKITNAVFGLKTTRWMVGMLVAWCSWLTFMLFK